MTSNISFLGFRNKLNCDNYELIKYIYIYTFFSIEHYLKTFSM